MLTALEHALGRVLAMHAGTGGALAVLREGSVLARHAWGWADAERRLAFAASTPFRMCSITKQFTCALARDLFEDLGTLDAFIVPSHSRGTQSMPVIGRSEAQEARTPRPRMANLLETCPVHPGAGPANV